MNTAQGNPTQSLPYEQHKEQIHFGPKKPPFIELQWIYLAEQSNLVWELCGFVEFTRRIFLLNPTFFKTVPKYGQKTQLLTLSFLNVWVWDQQPHSTFPLSLPCLCRGESKGILFSNTCWHKLRITVTARLTQIYTFIHKVVIGNILYANPPIRLHFGTTVAFPKSMLRVKISTSSPEAHLLYLNIFTLKILFGEKH